VGGGFEKQISIEDTPPDADALDAVEEAGAALGDGIGERAGPAAELDPVGAGIAERVAAASGVSGAALAAGAASAAGLAEATGVATTKVNVTPGGKTTRWPVATAVTAAGGALRPNPPKTDPTAFAAVDAALCAALVTLAELLVTAIACPPTVKVVS
jgi:hypothetical protein